MTHYNENVRQHLHSCNRDGWMHGETRHVFGTVVQVFTDRTARNGAEHQQIRIAQVEALDDGPDISDDVLVVIRVNEGRIREDIPFAVDTPVELKGMLIPGDRDNPSLPVLHLTHQPVGFVVYEGEHFE